MFETGNRTSPSVTFHNVSSEPIDVSRRVAVPVTTEELGVALSEGNSDQVKKWIADDRIMESTLSGRIRESLENTIFADLSNDDAGLEFSVVEFLNRVPPILFVDGTVAALIGLMSKDQVNEVGQDGHTPLTRFAADDRGKYVTQALIDRGANVNAVDRDNRTALIHNTVSGGSDGVTATLCGAGAEVNVRDKDGRTAMHYAVRGQDNVQILSLVGAGANKTVEDNDGWTPFDLADKLNQDEPSNVDAESTRHAINVSQEESLGLLSKLLGETFCAKLLRASTTAWDAIASALSYAMSVLPYREVVSEEKYAVAPPSASYVDHDVDDTFETVALAGESMSEIDDDGASYFDDIKDESMNDDDERFLPREAGRFESERFAADQREEHEDAVPPEDFWHFDEQGVPRSNDYEVFAPTAAGKVEDEPTQPEDIQYAIPPVYIGDDDLSSSVDLADDSMIDDDEVSTDGGKQA